MAIKYIPLNKVNKYKKYIGLRYEFLFSSFEEWYEELGKKPNNKLSVDRINNDGNYEIGNIRWATRSEQCINQRHENKGGF